VLAQALPRRNPSTPDLPRGQLLRCKQVIRRALISADCLGNFATPQAKSLANSLSMLRSTKVIYSPITS